MRPCGGRSGFSAFPLPQTERATFTALRFPVGPRYSGSADSKRPSERCTSRKGLSSAFLSCPFALFSFGLPWRTFTLSWPLQPGIWLLRRLRLPCRTLAFSRPTSWVKRYGSSPVPIVDVIAIRSCPLYAGCTVESSWSIPKSGQAGIFPFWVGRISQLRPSMFTTLQTGVPFVSIDRKGSTISPFWLGDFAHCQQASHPRSCHDRTHAAYPSHHDSCTTLNEQHQPSLKGTLWGA